MSKNQESMTHTAKKLSRQQKSPAISTSVGFKEKLYISKDKHTYGTKAKHI